MPHKKKSRSSKSIKRSHSSKASRYAKISKSHKKVSRKVTVKAPKKIKRKKSVTFIPEPWSKVTKYKKIKKDGYYGGFYF
ncbi:MAG TPA: hypothetical protein VK158_03630 [Acidobacteriota bacterium]|nr:hypothetical protein [Acidobacteriota bacterium]